MTSEPEPRDYFGQPFDPEEIYAAALNLARHGHSLLFLWVPSPRFDPEEFDALAQMSPAQLWNWEDEWWHRPLDESERQDLLRLRLEASEWSFVSSFEWYSENMEDPKRWELERLRKEERHWQIQNRRMEEIAALAPMSPDQREAWEEEWWQRPLEESERQELLWLRLKESHRQELKESHRQELFEESKRQELLEESERQELERLQRRECRRQEKWRSLRWERFDNRLGPDMPFRWEEPEMVLVDAPGPVVRPGESSPGVVTLAEAVAKSHLSVATIRRHLKAEQIPGAVRNPDRSWSIPVVSLWTTGIWAEGTWPAEPHD